MKTECQAKIAEAIKKITGDENRKISQAELDGIEQRIKASMKSLSLNDGTFQYMNKTERMEAAVKQAREWMMQDMVDAQERSINEALKRKQQEDYITAAPAGKKMQALSQLLVHNAGSKVSAQSIEVRKTAIAANLKRKLQDLIDYDSGKFFGILQDPAKQHDLMRALWGDKDADPEAIKAANTILKLNDHAVQLTKESGIPLNRNENYRLPQTQDPTLLAGRRDEWVNDFRQWVDPRSLLNADGSRMSPDQTIRWLGEVYNTLVSDGANKRALGEGSGGSALVGSALNKPRQLYFKDADSYVAAMDKYGKTTNVYDLMSSHIDRMARDMAVAQTLGRNYAENFQRMFARAQEADAQAASGVKDAEALKTNAARTQRLFDALTAPERPGNETAARIAANVRAVMGSSMLGGLFSNLPDMAMLKLAGHALNLPEVAMFRDLVKNTLGMKGAQDNAFALGISLDAWHHAVNRFSDETHISGWAQFLNDATHRLSGVSAMDRGMRMAVGAGLMRKIGSLAQRFDSLEKLEPGDRDLMQQWGIDQSHWDVLRKAGVDEDGKVTPALLDRTEGVDSKLLNQTQEKLLGAVYNEMQTFARGGMGASVTDRVRLGMDKAQAGTGMGEIWRFLTMFKSVPFGIFANHFLDAPMKLDGAGSRWAYRAKFMTYSTIMGALALQLKHMANGEDPENMDSKGFVLKSFLQGGGVGLYGDLLLHEATKAGSGDLMGAVGGPGADLAANLFKEYQTAKKEMDEGGTHNFASSALKIARQNFTPLMNIWYLKSAFNHLVYENLQDMVQPGYASQRGQKMQQQFGTNYWWGPNSTDGFNIMDRMPQRAPDLGAAWQPEQ